MVLLRLTVYPYFRGGNKSIGAIVSIHVTGVVSSSNVSHPTCGSLRDCHNRCPHLQYLCKADNAVEAFRFEPQMFAVAQLCRMFGQAKLGVFVIQVSRQQPCPACAQQVTFPRQQRGEHSDSCTIPVESVAKCDQFKCPAGKVS